MTMNDGEQLVSYGRFAPTGSYAARFEPVARKWKNNQRCLQYVGGIGDLWDYTEIEEAYIPRFYHDIICHSEVNWKHWWC